MTMKNDAKFHEELACHFKVDMRNLTNLMCFLWGKYILFELKKYRGVIFHETEEGYKIWRGIDLSFQNWHKEFDKFWPQHLKVSKIFALMGFFWAKYILLKLKKYRGVIYLSWNWRRIQNLERNRLVV